MRLKVFDIIDETIDLLEYNYSIYSIIEYELHEILKELLNGADMVADISSRIKSKDSLREKIIRNRLYKDYGSGELILANLSDLIGFLIKCRFIEDEQLVYEKLKNSMKAKDKDGTYYHPECYNFHLYLDEPQPLMQKNGFPIYRVDGYYLFEGKKVNIELQIKALVNSFWGDIEHKLVYKNTNYYVYDDFMKAILATINANLSITNRQLHIIYEQMQNNSQFSDALDESVFERQISKSINDLFNKKMSESMGFTLNVKNTSMILGHYIYKKDIKNTHGKNHSAASLYQIFNTLNDLDIEFEHEIEMETNFVSRDRFIHILGNYLISIINDDYDWYVFFRMLFAIEPGNNIEDFTLFLGIIKSYLIDNYWLSNTFKKLANHQSELLQDECSMILANSLCEISTIKIIHDEKMIIVKEKFKKFVEELETRVISYNDFKYYQGAYYDEWMKELRKIFK